MNFKKTSVHRRTIQTSMSYSIKKKPFLCFKTSQQQRDYYKDRSGEIHPIDDFILPVKNQAMYESFLP